VTSEKNRDRDIAVNRRARHEFLIEETVEAGVALMGSEVKALREGKANLKDSYGRIENGEVAVERPHQPVRPASQFGHEPTRTRKLPAPRRDRAPQRQGEGARPDRAAAALLQERSRQGRAALRRAARRCTTSARRSGIASSGARSTASWRHAAEGRAERGLRARIAARCLSTSLATNLANGIALQYGHGGPRSARYRR
jgi:hypothetical protein